jgi:hypothetical protein
MTVLFACVWAGAFEATAVAAVLFLTTVEVLPSLDSLMPLILRPARDVAAPLAAGAGAAAAAPLRVLQVAAVLNPLELAVEDAVAFRAIAPARVARVFSTMLLMMVVELAGFVGDTGRAIIDFAGDAGRSRGATRELEEAGDKTCDQFLEAISVAGPLRSFFLGFPMCATSFSLS